MARKVRPLGSLCVKGHRLEGDNVRDVVYKRTNPQTGEVRLIKWRRCLACEKLWEKRRCDRTRQRKAPKDDRTCKHGHPWTPENTRYVRRLTSTDHTGQPRYVQAAICRTCDRNRKREHYHRQKQQMNKAP